MNLFMCGPKQNIFYVNKQNQDMQGSENDEPRTPLRGEEDKEVAETGYKVEQESQVRQGTDNEADEILQQLEHYEQEIRRNEERLREIATEKIRHSDTSEQYARLEDERRTLRKELVDYDYEHKRLFQRYRALKEEADRRRREEQDRKIEEEIRALHRAREEAALERSRRLEQQLQEITESSRKRREEIQRLYQRPQETTAEEPPKETQQGEQQEGEKEKTEEEKLAQAKFNERVKEIEAQLASDRLRRSRQVQLEAELIRIRSYEPLHWYSLYGYSYYPLYPRLYPLYPRPLYEPLFYPRLYPYPYYLRYPYI